MIDWKQMAERKSLPKAWNTKEKLSTVAEIPVSERSTLKNRCEFDQPSLQSETSASEKKGKDPKLLKPLLLEKN